VVSKTRIGENYISLPSSVREGIRTTNTLAKKRYLIIYFIIITLSAQPAIFWFWLLWQLFPPPAMWFYALFPVFLIVGLVILIFSSIITSKIFLFFINLIYKPKEGVFERSTSDRDYRYWSLRSVVRKWPAWLVRHLNLPLFETIAFKILGIKTSFSCALNEGWVDCEFVEIGKNVKIGQGSVIMSNILIQDKLIVRKVVIKDNVVIGVHSVVTPGTIIESNAILDSISMTAINQHLKPNSIYSGIPAEIIEQNNPIMEKKKLENEIFEKIVEATYNEEDLKLHSKDLTVPFHFYVITGWLIIGGSYIAPAFLFLLYIYGFFIPNVFSNPITLNIFQNWTIITYLLITPIIIVGIYIFHLFFVALFAKWFYKRAKKRGPKEGIIDRNLDEQSTQMDYYHFGSFLMKYPIFSVIRSPFPWLIRWELNFMGTVRSGKGTIYEEGYYLHSLIDCGKNCYFGTFAHITNHLVDGVYGTENLTFYGAKIGDNCIFSSLMGGLPGLEIGDNVTFLPMGTTIKYDKIGSDGIYSFFPAKRLSKEEIENLTGGELDRE